LHHAEAALARDQAQLAGAERNLERYDAAVKDGLIPQQHADRKRRAVDEAGVAGAERPLDRSDAVVKDRLIPQQQADDQRALVEQLRGTVKADQAQIETARLMLDYARIKAPIDGVTGVRQVDPGNLVRAVDPTGIVI